MEGFFAPPFLGAECWSGAEHVFRSGVRKGVPSKNNGVYQSLGTTNKSNRYPSFTFYVILTLKSREVPLMTPWKAVVPLLLFLEKR